MSDEDYRRLKREGNETGIYDRAAYEELRLGRVDDVRAYMLEGLLSQTISDIVTARPELSYRAVEWFIAPLPPTQARVCAYCNEHHNAIPNQPCPQGHRPPTILEALTLLDADAQGHTNAEETQTVNHGFQPASLQRPPLIGVANAVIRNGQTLTFYKKPQMTEYTQPYNEDGERSIRTFAGERVSINAEPELSTVEALLARHPFLSTQFYAPRHFKERVDIRLPQSKYGHPLCILRGINHLEILISYEQPPMPIYVRER